MSEELEKALDLTHPIRAGFIVSRDIEKAMRDLEKEVTILESRVTNLLAISWFSLIGFTVLAILVLVMAEMAL